MTLRDIDAGLQALLAAALPAGTTVRAFTSRDLDRDGNLLILPPTAAVVFQGLPFSTRDIQSRTYDAPSEWSVVVVARDLSEPGAGRLDAYDLLQASMDALAGVDVVAGSERARIALLSVEAVAFGEGKAAYSLTVQVGALYQH